jgi:hypothetical protein
MYLKCVYIYTLRIRRSDQFLNELFSHLNFFFSKFVKTNSVLTDHTSGGNIEQIEELVKGVGTDGNMWITAARNTSALFPL